MTRDAIFSELRAAREAKGLTLDDIAEETLINVRFLESIESGDTTFQPPTYVRAFIRAYAACVDLDPAAIMRRLDGLPEPASAPAAAPDGTPPAPEPEPAPRPPFWSAPGVRTALTAFIVLAGVTLIVLFTRPDEEASAPPEIPISRMIRETEQRLTPPADTAPAGVPRAASTRDSLTLRATTTDSVWVQIAIDALPPTDYLFGPRASRQWRAHDRFLITLGNAGGVHFHLNGRDLGAFGKPGAVLRDFEITREALTSPVQVETRP